MIKLMVASLTDAAYNYSNCVVAQVYLTEHLYSYPKLDQHNQSEVIYMIYTYIYIVFKAFLPSLYLYVRRQDINILTLLAIVLIC